VRKCPATVDFDQTILVNIVTTIQFKKISKLKPIKSALISVFHKDRLEPVIAKLKELGVTIYSTGGTEKFIRGLGAEVNAVEDLTAYPSILGGRVKTLHPKVFGGILGRREESGDIAQLEEYSIPEIDLVIVDLYPFEDTVASGAGEQDIIEKIEVNRSYQKSEFLQIMRVLKNYDLLKDSQMGLFRD